MGEAEFVIAFGHVTDADVEVAIRAEDEVAAVVIPVDEWDLQQDALGVWVSQIGVGGGGEHLCNDEALGLLTGVAEVKLAVVGVVRVEGEAVEAFFEFAIGSFEVAIAEVEKKGSLGGGLILREDVDLAALKGEELAVAAIRWDLDGDGEGGFDGGEDGLQLDEVCGGAEAGQEEGW